MGHDIQNGKFSKYNAEILKLAKEGHTHRKVARMVIAKHKLSKEILDGLAIYVAALITYSAGEKPAAQSFDLTAKLKDAFKKKDVISLDELSNAFDIGIGRVRDSIEKLIAEGFNYKIDGNNVIFSRIIPKSESTVLKIEKPRSGFYKFGVVGDNHLCSRYERLDVLNALYDHFAEEGIEIVYNTGNWIDGEARFNKHDLNVHGFNRQLDYWIKNYPQRKGIVTHYITGDDHEGWYTQRDGINVGETSQLLATRSGRDDLKYIGHMEADIILPAPQGQTVIRVQHPGGGSAYAISYTAQKIVESFSGGEKPDILLIGHYHKAEYCYTRGVHVVQTACTQDQSPFMRKKRLAAHLGGWIIEVKTDDSGAVTRFKQEFFPFYDKGYHKKWGYKF
jgi:hypothetical protein